MSADLVKLEQAERMLAECASAADAQNIIDLAEAHRVYVKQAKLGTGAVNHATHIKLQAARLLADFIDQGQTSGAIAGKGNVRKSDISTLPDLGLTRQQVSESRLIRDHFSPEEIQSRIDQANARDVEVSRARLLRMARDRRAAADRDKRAREDEQRIADTRQVSDLRLGDFREVLADLSGVDAIITDPPYPKEFLPLLPDLAAFADKVLAPDGVLVILFGQTWLPDVYRLLGDGRPYRWTGCYLQPGSGYSSHARRVQSNWKPFLVYGGGPRFADVVNVKDANGASKRLHEWGQDLAGFQALVERFTRPGQMVCDPFAGSGTTLLAAQSLGRSAVGAELDPEHHRTAAARIAA